MANKHLRFDPHDVHVPGVFPEAWWYEEPAGITLYRDDRKVGYSRVGLIPWRECRAALARKDKK